jgi:hypothetical protein
MPGLVSKVGSNESAFSGRLKIAQRFYRWGSAAIEMKSVKRTAENMGMTDVYCSAVRLTDFSSTLLSPAVELLGYYHSSAFAD